MQTIESNNIIEKTFLEFLPFIDILLPSKFVSCDFYFSFTILISINRFTIEFFAK